VTALVVPPAGWTGGASQDLVEQTGRQGHFGGVHGVIEAERYDGANVVLYVTRVGATTASPGDAAEAELGLFGHPVVGRKIDDKAITVESAWRDGDVGGAARMVIATDGNRIAAVKGECYAGAEARPEAIAACTKALATIDPGIAAADRIAVPAPSTVPAVPQLSTPGPSQTHVAMPPMTVKQAPDRRPVYVGAGLIVIAAVFYWNRRRAAHVR
jgi:hypothetical protein